MIIGYLQNLLFILLPISFLFGQFSSNLIITIITLIFFFNIKKYLSQIKFSFLLNIIILLNFIIVIFFIFSENLIQPLENEGSILFFRYILFSIALSCYFFYNENYLKHFFISLFLVLIIVLCDGYFQWFFDKNIMGYTPESVLRLSGVFKDEYILGSFLQKIYPIFLSLSLFIYNKPKKSNIYFFIISFLVFNLIILSGDRSALVNFILLMIILTSILHSYNKYFYLITIISIISFLSLSIFDNNVSKRVSNTFNLISFSNYSFILHTTNHDPIFEKVKLIHKDNWLVGIGTNTFRNYCKNLKDNNGCNNHPHNFYLQLMIENGIAGLFVITFLLLYLIYKFYLNTKEYLLVKDKKFLPLLTVQLAAIIYLNPFLPNVSFYNTWASIFFFLYIGLIFFYEKKLAIN